MLLEALPSDSDAVRAVILGRCWAESPWAARLRLRLALGESLAEHADRTKLGWSPQWLLDASYVPYDAAGEALELHTGATKAGQIRWSPAVRLPKVDDQVANAKPDTDPNAMRRLSGEVAVAALWRRAALRLPNLQEFRPRKLNGNSRGARYKNSIVHCLRTGLPAEWDVRPELSLRTIRGLHLRRDVGGRQSDIAVLDPAGSFMAMISSKWTWRSDRGTEAAQIVALKRYRPDIPYLLATSEFPRAANLVRESVEDLVFHTCPSWLGAWSVVNASDPGVANSLYRTLDALETEGVRASGPQGMGLGDLIDLPGQLSDSGRVG